MAADPRRVKELFVALLDLPDPQARQAFLEHECAADTDLRQRLEALLRAHENPATALERPLAVAGPATADYHGPAEDVGAIIASRYKLLEQIGEGGMGTVWVAEQTQPVRRKVALKLIKAGMDSKNVLSRFEAERQALALMDHPNIAKVLDGGTTESGRPFFVMEYVKGIPFTRYCDDARLSIAERLALFVPVCQAVQHAHQKGIIHRDLKPSNILICLYDGKPVPKVIDFGLAKAMHQPLTEHTLHTAHGAMMGTPLYMSPEQAEFNNLDVDTRTDIYALGVILYELLTGTTPLEKQRFQKAAWQEILRLIKEEEPPRPSARLSGSGSLPSLAAQRQLEPVKLAKLVRGELDWIVMKCLEKDRSRRYDTANGLTRDVERYLADEVVEARPPSAGYRLRKFMRKHRTALAMAATVLLLLVAGVAISTWLAVLARRAELAAKENREEAVEQRRQADEQRKVAETQAASVAMDMDLKYCEDGEIALGLLRLAETLKSIPEHAKELRECAALNILAWGQKIRPAWTLNHDGFDLTQAILSPDGRTVLSLGRDGTLRFWDSVSGKQRKMIRQPLQGINRQFGQVTFSHDESTALTIDWRGHLFNYQASDPVAVVGLWDVATGQLRVATSEHPGNVGEARLSQNGSLLVTTSNDTVFMWNARTGQLLRKVTCRRNWPSIDVSPDGRWVLIAQDGQFAVWSPESDQPLKRLPGDKAVFSPIGRSAASVSGDTLYWWQSKDWQLHRTINLSIPKWYGAGQPSFITDEVLGVTLSAMGSPAYQLVALRNVPEIIREVGGSLESWTNTITVSRDGRVVILGSHVYDGLSGQRIPLARGHKFHRELSQLSDDGRFTPFHVSYIIDLVADKMIDFRDRPRDEWRAEGRFVKDLETWIVLSSDRIYVLRKADASLDAGLLQKWSQVITRGKLDEGGRFSKFDEDAWEKSRLELAHLLDANPNAQALRAAVSDPLYWLRQEIRDKPRDIPLWDRLVAAEPTWPHYSQRAAVHVELEHWDLAIQDDLEAARLAGERYWLRGTSIFDWQVAARSVKAPGSPREQYERALRWVEARTRAGVAYEEHIIAPQYRLRPTIIAGLALYRLGRYEEALAMLRKNDVPMISQATGMLMSPWNLLTVMQYTHIFENGIPIKDSPIDINIGYFSFESNDLLIRAMCYHHLRQPKEAKACLNEARSRLGNNPDQRAFLRESESLIEGKLRP